MLNGLGYALQFVVTILLTPFVIRHVGRDGYGVWLLASALGGNYGLVNLGLGSALIRHVAVYSARGEHEKARQVSATALTFLASTGLFICCLTWIFAGQTAALLGVAPANVKDFEWLIRLTGVSALLDFMGVVYTTKLNAHEQFTSAGVRKIALIIGKGGLTVAVLAAGFGLTGLGVTAAAMSLLSLAINIGQVRGIFGAGAVTFRGRSMKMLRELLRYGLSTFLMQLVDLARMRLGPLMLAKSIGVGAVANFGLASGLVTQFNAMVGTVVGVLNARVARLDGQSSHEELRHVFRKSLFFCSTVACAFMMMIYLFGPRFMHLWVGKSFDGAIPVLHVLALAYGLAAAQSSGWSVMFGLGKHHFMAAASLIEIGIIAIGGWFLVPLYGELGMACAVTGAMVITKVLLQPVYVAKITGISLKSYLEPLAFPFLTGGAIVAGALFLRLPGYLADAPVFMWILTGILLASLYFGLVLALSYRAVYFVNPLPNKLVVRFRTMMKKPLKKSCASE